MTFELDIARALLVGHLENDSRVRIGRLEYLDDALDLVVSDRQIELRCGVMRNRNGRGRKCQQG